MKFTFGKTNVCTRLPLTTRRISIVCMVKANKYGKAHTVNKQTNKTNLIYLEVQWNLP